MRVAMGNGRGKGKAGSGVSGGKRPASAPKLAMAAGLIGELAIKAEFESKIEGAGCAHSGEGDQAVVAQGRFVFHAARTPSGKTRGNFAPQADVRPQTSQMLNRSAPNTIRRGLVALCDEHTGGCRDGELPFKVLESNGVPGRMFYRTQQRTCVAEYLVSR